MLFGVPLKGQTRTQLRQVFKAHGMTPTREDKSYWYDDYDPHSLLKGASKFSVGYVHATQRFALAEYTFPGSEDTELVARIIAVVQAKYGPPSTMNGNVALGPVLAIWHFPNDVGISVSRDWPDTTTYLDYIDRPALLAMDAEIDANKRRRAEQDVNSQNSAY
jgi:hypothetical protein